MSAPAQAKKKTKLLAITPASVEPKKPKVLIYGPAGVGKTWISLDFPDVYYIDTEGGADLAHYRNKLRAAGGMYFGPDQGSLDFDTLIGQIEALATERHKYKTVVVDSISKVFNSAITDEQIRLGERDAFGASKKNPIRQMAKLLRWINRADITAVLIAHEKDLWGQSSTGQREAIGKTADAWEKLEYELHLVLRISKIGAGDNAKRYANIGKSRLPSFPEGTRFDWTYPEFSQRYGKDVIETAAVPVVLATPAEVKEIKDLLEIVKLPDGLDKKWLNAASAETWDEMSHDQIAACIGALKQRMANKKEEPAHEV